MQERATDRRQVGRADAALSEQAALVSRGDRADYSFAACAMSHSGQGRHGFTGPPR
jgi:hypothetical protein